MPATTRPKRPPTTAIPKREPMSATEAKNFSRFSIANAAQAMRQLQESGACRGGCNAYEDIYTYKRWLAQGYQVRKGQHGAKLSIIILRDATDDDKTNGDDAGKVQMPWSTTVFCRHQVDKSAEAANTGAQ